MKTFKQLLIELNACKPAIEWAGDKTIEQVVAECDNGEWLAWLAQKIELDKRSLVLVGGHIANTVRHLMTDDRSKQAVDVCIAYGEGRASDDELSEAAESAAESASRAETMAVEAAWATAEAAEAAWSAARAASAANRKQTADICRQYIGEAIIQQTNKLLTQ